MMLVQSIASALIATLLAQTCLAISHEELIQLLGKSKIVTEASIKAIHDEWKIDEYPNFLKSCSMHKSGYELMKYKFMSRILSSNEVPGRKGTFVASFLGSSVTAGHDSHFNKSTPVVVGELMSAAFDSLNINFESRNAALGNNPCVPYDVCTKVFAGLDADIVHWEQSYFCFGGAIIEQFVRQSMLIPTRPIVVFSESNTAHWQKDQCRQEPHVLTNNDKELLAKPTELLVTEANKDEAGRAFSHVAHYEKKYPGAGIQKFTHEKHKDYACLGPYIKDWMLGAASWHPSVVAHRLRASHHSYFWLVILKEATEDLIKLLNTNTQRSTDALYKDIELKLSHIYKPLPPPHHYSVFSNGMNCYTDYEPHHMHNVSLRDRAISGLLVDSVVEGNGWRPIIYEDLVDKKLVEQSKKRAYLDYKHLIYGNSASGPLVLKVTIEKDGPLFICQTPGIWGGLPKGFKDLWSGMDTPSVSINSMGTGTAYQNVVLSIYHNKELDICVMLVQPPESGSTAAPVKSTYPPKPQTIFKAGEHQLTIKANTANKIIIAWLLTS